MNEKRCPIFGRMVFVRTTSPKERSTLKVKSTTNISKMKSEFTLKNATSFAGSKLILHFLEQIAFPKILKRLLKGKAPNATFPLSYVVLYLIIGWILGFRRIFQFRTLQEDSLIQQFMGKPLPHYSLLYKDLLRMGKDPFLFTKFQSLNRVLVEPLLPSSLILDFDSTIETVYGNQEGAAVGVNPHKPGRKSYHPLVVFEAQSQSCLNAVLRPGNVHSSSEALPFAEQTLKRLPAGKTVKYVRFDKGFGGETFYRFWEERKIGYVGKIKWTARLEQQAYWHRHKWTRYVDDDLILEGLSMEYRGTSWDRMRRVVVIRKAIRCKEPQLFEWYDWEYEAMVTNLNWDPYDVWHFYNQRCTVENRIKEMKSGFSIDAIPTQAFGANHVDLWIKVMAYNLFVRFKKQVCEPVHMSYTIQRFREEFFRIPGVIIRHSRRVVIKMAQSFSKQRVWLQMERKVVLLE